MRDRVSQLEMIPASALIPHPLNWRSHPSEQREVLTSILDTVGFVGAIRAYPDGDKYVIVDGHLRQELSGDQLVPVLILDLTPAEAKLLLLTGDELSSLAESDREATERLLEEIQASGLQLPDQIEGLFSGMLETDDPEESSDPVPSSTVSDVRDGERQEMTELRFRRYMIHCDRATFDTIRQSVIDWADNAGTSEGWADAMVDRLSSQITGG